MSAANKSKATLASVLPEQPHMPVFSTSGAMSMLWQKASGSMTLQELEWLANGAARQARSEADSLATVMMNTACLVQADEGNIGSFLDADSAADLFFNLHNQLSAIAGLADIAEQAGYRVRLALKGQQ